MSLNNPFFHMAVLSLKNALEFYQDKDQESKERHRFGALILMDLSVEYILKAKLYELKPKFVENTHDLGFSDVMRQNEIKILFLDDEESHLWTVHLVRNLAQHRGHIPDSIRTPEYFEWLGTFVKRFSSEYFSDIASELPLDLKVTWSKLTYKETKTPSVEPFVLKKKIEDYDSVKTWIHFREDKSRRGVLMKDDRESSIDKLARYCKFMKMNPDDLIENALNGRLSPDEKLEDFYKTITSTPYPYWIVIKSFYDSKGIKLVSIGPKFKPRYTTEELTTEQLQRICNAGNMESKSWILANSYMGLGVGKLSLLKVEDFHTDKWNVPKSLYPVKIRQEVNGHFDYTTFIGEDAKQELKKYFDEKNFSSQDHPWNYKYKKLNYMFRRDALKAGVIKEKGSGRYTVTPKSITKRLKNSLKDSMRDEWIRHILGLKQRDKRTEFNRPLDDDLAKAYEKALSKLEVFKT